MGCKSGVTGPLGLYRGLRVLYPRYCVFKLFVHDEIVKVRVRFAVVHDCISGFALKSYLVNCHCVVGTGRGAELACPPGAIGAGLQHHAETAM